MWITVWKTIGKTHIQQRRGPEKWILTTFIPLFTQLFHSFLLKKDINLVILHQKPKMWKTLQPFSFSTRKN